MGLEVAWVDVTVDIFATMRMPLFFAASGLFAGSWLKRSWPQLLRGKVVLLAWVFLAWQPVVFAYKLLEMYFLPGQPDNSLLGQVGKVLLSPLRPNGELWFLWALAVFFIFAKVAARVPPRIQLATAALVSILWLSFSNALVPDSVIRLLGNGWSGVFSYYFFFLAGVYFSKGLLSWVANCAWYVCAVGVMVWGAVAWVRMTYLVDVPGMMFFVSCLGAVAGFQLAKLLWFASLLELLGKNTLPIYVAHTFVLVVLTVALYHSPFYALALAWPGVTAAVWVVLAVLCAWWIHAGLVRTRFGSLFYRPPSALAGFASAHKS